jgi:hypothetical protein
MGLQLSVNTLKLRIVYVPYQTSQIYITEFVWPTLNGERMLAQHVLTFCEAVVVAVSGAYFQ